MDLVKWVKDECWISGCSSPTTHILESRVMTRATDPEYPVEPYTQLVGYCLYDAQHIAVSLVWKYDHQYEVVDLRAAAPDDWPEEGEGIYEVN